ncbi:MAG: proline--tRNA ligase [Deltaproteobacteria bacterium]|nr:proline--tRNA ligase [Deltaproteobacteria bacterium]
MEKSTSSRERKTAISPLRSEDYPEWYQQVIKASDLAENSPVRGCMVIKPWGYAIWENIQRVLDKRFKETGHVNAYFPLLIPLSFMEKEAEHVEGFAKECAVVTHHRLQADSQGKLRPSGQLEEPYVIRPTSETIIGHSYSKWIQSYRDLPVLINQWANVMRWEMRTRLFLRTSEFLWQEGHTAHATQEEAWEETLRMLDVYRDFAKDWLAVPTVAGRKTPDERFPGAVETLTFEAMMQDRKALQFGTSHFLGQNFAKAFDIQFLDQDGERKYVWTTSWGSTTRYIGGLVMTHSDDDGLVLPPRIAPQQIVIMPILKKDSSEVLEFCERLKKELEAQNLHGEPVRVFIDKRDMTGGEKGWDHVKKGVPIRVEVGPRDIAKQSVFVGRRDQGVTDKRSLPVSEFVKTIGGTLSEMQAGLYAKAEAFLKQNLRQIDSLDEFEAFFTPKGKDEEREIFGGFALTHWNEAAIGHPLLKKLKVTPRCIPHTREEWGVGIEEKGRCLFTGKDSKVRVIFGRAY